MDFVFTPEHEELRTTVRRFLEAKSPEAVVRGLMGTESGYSEDTWRQMAEQLGLQALIIPEEHGGAGMGPVELSIVLEEMGRALLCAPYLSSAVVAVHTLLHAGDAAAQSDLLPRIAAGETLATLAVAEEHCGWDLASLKTEATAEGGVWHLDGAKTYVVDGHVADVILVAARTADGVGVFRVEAEAQGLERRLLPTLDLTRKLAAVSFSRTPAARISPAGDSSPAVERVLSLAAGAIAAEQTGGAERCLEMATEYAKTRLQFGRAIGSFQAIKHRCADMLIDVEFAKSAAYNAAFTAVDGDSEEVAAAASLAKSFCSEAFFKAAGDTIQIHGGMGFTWEHPAHLYFKRAKSSSVLFGDAGYHREKLAQQIGV
jgi:alkylation response protein AidB-like acyl-CoA dehydrogenase